jgi:hypothetical protein
MDGINKFRCACQRGYEGKYCEIDIDECKSSPCIHGKCWQNSDENAFIRRLEHSSTATLSPVTTLTSFKLDSHSASTTSLDLFINYKFDYTKAAGYWCECDLGYSGANCELKTNECESSPCGSNGKCVDLVNHFKCVCLAGYTGRTCEQNINECQVYSPCAESSRCHDLVPDYNSLMANKSNLDASNTDLYLEGYYCDCSELNEKLFRSTGSRDVIYAGQNCSIKLNACENKKHLCKHDSTCQSILVRSPDNRTQHQDFDCLCKPGFTGKYCEVLTTFRMDGTYFLNKYFSLAQVSQANAYRFHMKFDFRVKNAYKLSQMSEKMPLIYLESFTSMNNFLLFEVSLHGEYISVANSRLNLYDNIGFVYHHDENLESQQSNLWHSLEIMMLDENTYQINYSVKKMKLSVSKKFNLINVDTFGNLTKASQFIPMIKKLAPTSFTLGKAYNLLYKNLNSYEALKATGEQQIYKNDNYLNNFCVRDFTLNNAILYKSVNDKNEIDSNTNKLKFGCDEKLVTGVVDRCSSNVQASTCLNNATCIDGWFNYECIDCKWPFYGKRCQLGKI